MWSNIFYFSDCPRACIVSLKSHFKSHPTSRFKTIICTLLRAFEFGPAAPPEDVVGRAGAVVGSIMNAKLIKAINYLCWSYRCVVEFVNGSMHNASCAAFDNTFSFQSLPHSSEDLQTCDKC